MQNSSTQVQQSSVILPIGKPLLAEGLRVMVEDNPVPGRIKKYCMELGGKNDRYHCYYVAYDNGCLGIVNEDKIRLI